MLKYILEVQQAVVETLNRGQEVVTPGQYLMHGDVDAHEGRGWAELTSDPMRALVFESREEAHRFWRRQSTVRPWRPDGMPNRPLTAFTVAIVPRPDQPTN